MSGVHCTVYSAELQYLLTALLEYVTPKLFGSNYGRSVCDLIFILSY